MIILVGKSGTGKTTIRDLLAEYGFKKAVSSTTRPMRTDDVPDVTYHFVTESEFLRMQERHAFVEGTVAKYSDYYYGLSIDEMRDNAIAILEPNGLRGLRKAGIDITAILLDADDTEREKRLIARGDRIEEIRKRLKNDEMLFAGVDDICDYVVNTVGYSPEEIANLVANIATAEA